MDANTPPFPITGQGLLDALAFSASPAPSPEPEEAPRGLLRRAWDAWRDPEGRELTCREFGEYQGSWYVSSGWWTGGEQIGLGFTLQHDSREEWQGLMSKRTIRMLHMSVYVGPVSYHVAVERS